MEERSRRAHDLDNFGCGLMGVSIRDQMDEGVLERRLPNHCLQFGGGSVRDHPTLPENHHVGADFFDDFEDMRAIEDRFAVFT
jgi:hypothetical protein